MEWVEILIKAIPNWLDPFVDVLIKATPAFGDLPPIMAISGFVLLFMGWEYLNEGR